MAFTSASFTPLVRQGQFTLWNYNTTDSRAAVLALNYFSSVSGSVKAGDVIILHASDGLSFLPVRDTAVVGNGLVLDTSVAPLSFSRLAAASFGVTTTAALT
ncbi:hypothetical protein [Roseomonas elaeocarpi]|uniref:Uncharacterized protein n=1 Tax=Roseomonas elaeocarpi TaxID=907779 RepID=A0ABV6JQJ4_9PROT